MRRFIATLYLAVSSFLLMAQNDNSLPRISGDTLLTSSGYKIATNTKLKLGAGTMPEGDFKFIRISSTSFFHNSADDDKERAAVNNANALPSKNAGYEFPVLRVDTRGNQKKGYVYYPIITVGMKRFEIDIENAIRTGEVVIPDEFKPSSKPAVVQVTQPISVADELTKLKKLLDDGVLTKEEYEAQKKKLLEKN